MIMVLMQGVSQKGGNLRLAEIWKLTQMCCGSAFPSGSGSGPSSDSLACVSFCHFPHFKGNGEQV